jgi:hypothetical protein
MIINLMKGEPETPVTETVEELEARLAECREHLAKAVASKVKLDKDFLEAQSRGEGEIVASLRERLTKVADWIKGDHIRIRRAEQELIRARRRDRDLEEPALLETLKEKEAAYLAAQAEYQDTRAAFEALGAAQRFDAGRFSALHWEIVEMLKAEHKSTQAVLSIA